MSLPQQSLRPFDGVFPSATQYSQPVLESNVDLPDRNARRQMSPVAAHALAWSGEFVGTFMFLFLGYANNTVGANQASDTGPNGTKSSETILFIALGYSLAIMVNVWVMMRISGSHFNPAVTLGAVVAGNCQAIRGAIMVTAQVLGSIIAGLLVEVIFPGKVALANTTLGTGATTTQGFFMEVFFTAQLMLVVLFLGQEKSKDSVIIPLGVGLAIFASQMPGIAFTGGAVNPVRAFGCAVASSTFVPYHWIYWIGPMVGALIATAYYRFTKFFKDMEGSWEPPVILPIKGVEVELCQDGRKTSPPS